MAYQFTNRGPLTTIFTPPASCLSLTTPVGETYLQVGHWISGGTECYPSRTGTASFIDGTTEQGKITTRLHSIAPVGGGLQYLYLWYFPQVKMYQPICVTQLDSPRLLINAFSTTLLPKGVNLELRLDKF